MLNVTRPGVGVVQGAEREQMTLKRDPLSILLLTLEGLGGPLWASSLLGVRHTYFISGNVQACL